MIELLVVTGIIGILVSLLLPAVRKANSRAHAVVCMNNMRQLGIAFQLYTDSNSDQMPAGGSRGHYGPQPEDWIWWHNGRDVRKSAIAPYVSDFNPKLFRCPQDEFARALSIDDELEGNPYRYSYSMTSYQNYTDHNPGMTTLIPKDRQKILYFRRSDILNPSKKLMLVEEDRRYLDDARWVPGDYVIGANDWIARDGTNNAAMAPLSGRHSTRSNGLHADGHAEYVTSNLGYELDNSHPFFR